MGVYTMMTTTALHLGNAVMAAHQIALNVFWSLTYFVDPLFVACDLLHLSPETLNATRRKRKPSPKNSSFFPSPSASSSPSSPSWSPRLPLERYHGLLRPILVRSVSVYMLVSQCVSAVVFVSEGILIGAGDARYYSARTCSTSSPSPSFYEALVTSPWVYEAYGSPSSRTKYFG